MDVADDRFIVLSRFSATVWSRFLQGSGWRELVSLIGSTASSSSEPAESLLLEQVQAWVRAGLLTTTPTSTSAPLPGSKPAQPEPQREVSRSVIRQARLSPWLLARLWHAESTFRRALVRVGLARSLMMMQSVRGWTGRPARDPVARVLRSYYALRTAFRQGDTARDCLPRSMALAATLRRDGIDAHLCIGVTDLPFSSHAWVEASDVLVNERLVVRRRYTVIGRF